MVFPVPALSFVQWSLEPAVNLAGGVVIALFGLLVALVPPKGRVQLGFGLFAVSWGAATATANLAAMTPDDHVWLAAIPWLAALYPAGGVAGLVVLWIHMPVQQVRPRPWILAPAVVTVLLFAVSTAYSLTRVSEFEGAFVKGAPVAVATGIVWGFWGGLLLILVLRYLKPGGSPELYRQVPILSAGLVLYLAVNARWSHPAHVVPMRIHGTLILVFILVFAVLWLIASAVGPHPRAARNVAWITLAGGLLGFVHDADLFRSGAIGIDGLARLATVVVLAVAILRFQALGIHTQLRFGISKSTLAGVFIATFFVASEVAAVFFSQFAQSEVVGILAAGLLVFAIAPLQRFADRLADRAVPVEESGRTAGGAEDSYRSALRWALRDGALDRSEEERLLALAEDLGIPLRRAFALRSDVEAELRLERT